MTAKTYDSKCWDLADEFLSGHPHLHTDKHTGSLAGYIQCAIEDYIEDANNNYEPPETGDAWTGGFADNH